MAGIQSVEGRYNVQAVANVPPIGKQFDDTAGDSDKTFTVPTNEMWKLNFAHIIFVSTATAGNRQLVMEIADADGNVLIDMHAGTTQAASLTRHYSFMQGVYRETSFIDESLQVPFPFDTYLGPGYTLRFYDSGVKDPTADDMTVSFQYQKFTV